MLRFGAIIIGSNGVVVVEYSSSMIIFVVVVEWLESSESFESFESSVIYKAYNNIVHYKLPSKTY